MGGNKKTDKNRGNKKKWEKGLKKIWQRKERIISRVNGMIMKLWQP